VRPEALQRPHLSALSAPEHLSALANLSAPDALAELKHLAIVGVQYIVDARGCDPEALRSLPRLQALFSQVLEELALEAAAPPVWYVFPGEGGITGMVLLTESHLTVHTFPESGCATFDLYCCRRSADWSWEARLRETLGATSVSLTRLARG
jgi:S-adenosylmethionine decarboxylase